ncbi:MAG: YciK family oxidoreductase [Gammaproteobacteria bacterium]|nr:YciK family oxidoreductase [Gammaproteobacteria bacterium]MCP4413285.1 YciK family oxidoreductase [Gammaproteobacteria bacterium]
MSSTVFNTKTYQPASNLLVDKVILVTGAGDGIGRAAAETYAKYGATVILLGKTTSKLESVYDAIIEAGGATPAIYPMNLEGASPTDYEDLAKVISKEFGKLDGLLQNAGILGTLSPIENQSIETWYKVQQINVNATFMLTQACLPLLKKAPTASIIFTSSGVGRKGRAYWGAYAVSKFATEGLMQILADELETNTKVRSNCINPGACRTAMRAAAYPGEDISTNPTPAEIMPLYLYLMGDESSEISGQSLDAQ